MHWRHHSVRGVVKSHIITILSTQSHSLQGTKTGTETISTRNKTQNYWPPPPGHVGVARNDRPPWRRGPACTRRLGPCRAWVRAARGKWRVGADDTMGRGEAEARREVTRLAARWSGKKRMDTSHDEGSQPSCESLKDGRGPPQNVHSVFPCVRGQNV